MYKEALQKCHERIKEYIHNTPVLTSTQLNALTGASLFFKCENFQRMGAYKIRGAINAILSLSEEQRRRGVVTHSSGNFAQAIALAAKSLGIDAYIIMPSNAPKVKKDAVVGYGGIVTICPPTMKDREIYAKRIMNDYGATFLHPSNQMEVILGQGTAAKELLEEQPNLDYILCPVGGGGLIAGSALAAFYYGVNCRVIGGEPLAVDDAFRSLQSGKIETNQTTDTVADGLRTHLGDINFPIIQKFVDSIIRVTEEEIIDAMKLIWERMKIVVEPSSAVPFAALISKKEIFKDKKVGIIISGGNVDLAGLPFA